jgi:hypothetical protein
MKSVQTRNGRWKVKRAESLITLGIDSVTARTFHPWLTAFWAFLKNKKKGRITQQKPKIKLLSSMISYPVLRCLFLTLPADTIKAFTKRKTVGRIKRYQHMFGGYRRKALDQIVR